MLTTLDKMLEDLNDGSLTKTAAVESPRSSPNLKDRLLKAASAGLAPAEVREAASRELVEKTAEINVIALTLAEIEQAMTNDGEKTASVAKPTAQHEKIASFMKAAIDTGYSNMEIAMFLKQAGLAGKATELASKGKGWYQDILAALANVGMSKGLPADKVLPAVGALQNPAATIAKHKIPLAAGGLAGGVAGLALGRASKRGEKHEDRN